MDPHRSFRAHDRIVVPVAASSKASQYLRVFARAQLSDPVRGRHVSSGARLVHGNARLAFIYRSGNIKRPSEAATRSPRSGFPSPDRRSPSQGMGIRSLLPPPAAACFLWCNLLRLRLGFLCRIEILGSFLGDPLRSAPLHIIS